MAGSSLFTRSYSPFPVHGNFSKPKGKPNQTKGKPDQGKVKEFQEFSFRESGLNNGLRANPNFFPVASKFAPLWPPGDPRRACVIALRRARLFSAALVFVPAPASAIGVGRFRQSEGIIQALRIISKKLLLGRRSAASGSAA